MRAHVFIASLLAIAVPVAAQASKKSPQQLPKNPRAILAAAAPLYNLADPALKPWHLKATYQLYDESGWPKEKGTFEYWWVSPKVHRSTWTRTGVSRTDWHTADGKHEYLASGGELSYLEYKLRSVLISPLADISGLNFADFQTEMSSLSSNGRKYPCVLIGRPSHRGRRIPFLDSLRYCFDPQLPPVLRISETDGLIVDFNRNFEVQKKFMASQLQLGVAGHEMLSARVVAFTHLAPTNPALIPPVGALPVKAETVLASNLTEGALNEMPKIDFPSASLGDPSAPQSGGAVVQLTIGTTGSVCEVKPVWSTSTAFASSVMDAARRLKFKPLLRDGKPAKEMRLMNIYFKIVVQQPWD